MKNHQMLKDWLEQKPIEDQHRILQAALIAELKADCAAKAKPRKAVKTDGA